MIDERLVIIRVSNALLLTLLPPANEVCGGHGFTGVCLSTGVGEGGVLVSVQGGGLRPGGLCLEGSDQGVLCPGGLCPEMVSVGGGGGGGVLSWRPLDRAGGTHPTGMHSCLSGN